MRVNRLISKKADLLLFDKPENTFVRIRKQPQNYYFDYILVGSIVMLIILLIVYVSVGFSL